MKKYSTKTLFLSIFICSCVSAQKGLIQGILIDSMSGGGVSYAQIYNESSKTYTVSDSSGIFKLRGRINDTLAILSISYYGKVWQVKETDRNIIPLTIRKYEIKPVVINATKDYTQFKKAFLEYQPEKGPVIDGFPRYIPKLVPELLDTNIIETTGFAIMHPIAYLYLKYSNEEQSKRKVLYLKHELKEQVIIDQKYNPEIIIRLTGLKNEELTDFILFCNFDHKYLFESSDYEIVDAIARKFEEFKLIKTE